MTTIYNLSDLVSILNPNDDVQTIRRRQRAWFWQTFTEVRAMDRAARSHSVGV